MNQFMALFPGAVSVAFAMIDEFVAAPAELVFVVPVTVVVFVTVTFKPIANKTSKVTNEFLALFKFHGFIKR
jgi:hypothetical protein